MAARKKKALPTPLTDEQMRQRREEYDAAYVIMCKCTELERYREMLARLPERRARAGEDWEQVCPWVGLPIGMSEQDVLDAIARLERETTAERREWMCSVMTRHMMSFNPDLYLIPQAN